MDRVGGLAPPEPLEGLRNCRLLPLGPPLLYELVVAVLGLRGMSETSVIRAAWDTSA